MTRSYRVVAVVGLGVLLWGGLGVRPPQERLAAREDAPVLSVLYAMPAERVENHVLRRGETLGAVLARANIGGGELSSMLLAFSEHADPRRLASGSEIRFRFLAREAEPRAVEIGLDPDTRLFLHRRTDGWESEVAVTPTTVDTMYVAGVIAPGQSLYNAIMRDAWLQDLSERERDRLVHELANVYAFKVDLGRDIQPGDSYRMVYEREVRPDGTSRAQRVLVAELINRGRVYPAVHFEVPGAGVGHYDLEGRTLRSGFRRYPFDRPRITSGFGRRLHPITGVFRQHQGIDFGAPHGTPITATADGVVVSAGYNGGYGNTVILRHQGGYTTLYAHMSRIEPGIRSGRAVSENQRIGYVGATGLATGPHLHYELRLNGRHLDPRTARLPDAPPLPAELLPEFRVIAADRVAVLEAAAVNGPRFALDASRRAGNGEGEVDGVDGGS
jgi:murein DD-endopeptidase MepM/ murein hydrolase activator NlpD